MLTEKGIASLKEPNLKGPIRQPKSTSKSASRALEVLEYLGKTRKAVRAKQICETLRLSSSTGDQLLKTMVGSGFLIFDPIEKTYHPSPRLLNFSTWMTSVCFWSSDSRQVLKELQVQTASNASLLIGSDAVMRIVELEGAHPSLPTLIGSRAPLHTIAGQAFLASRSERQASQLVDRAERLSLLPKDAIPELMERVQVARAVGYSGGGCASPFFQRPWAVAIAVPMHWAAPSSHVVVCVIGNEDDIRHRESQVADIMHQTTRGMSSQQLI